MPGHLDPSSSAPAPRNLPARPNLDQYKKQAKDLLKRWKSDDPNTTRKLADAQFVIAREHGFETWKVFIDRIGEAEPGSDSRTLASRGLILRWVDGPARLSSEEVDALFRRLAMPALKAMG
jgi:hypothetical protein